MLSIQHLYTSQCDSQFENPQQQYFWSTLQKFTEGYMNCMLCCHLVSDEHKSDAVVVRVFVNSVTFATVDRDTEVMSIQVAAAINVAAPVYALFKNGIVYKYAPGRTLTGDDLTKPELIR